LKNASNRFSCVSIFSSKLGIDDPELQKQEMQAFAKFNGFKIESYIDTAKFDSLSLEQICEKMSKIRQSAVLIWRLDCLPSTVSTMEDLFQIVHTLSKANVSFLSIKDGIDTDAIASAFVDSVSVGWKLCKRNRKITNARASSIKTKAKNVKFKTGRKKQRDDVLIHNLRASGYSIRKIASEIRLSTMAVQRSLKTYQQTILGIQSPLDYSPDM